MPRAPPGSGRGGRGPGREAGSRRGGRGYRPARVQPRSLGRQRVARRSSPLRDRREAIPGLAKHFLARCNEQYARDVTQPTELVALMCEYHWPGNVRELENFVRRLVVLGDTQRAIDELRGRLRATRPAAAPLRSTRSATPGGPGEPGALSGVGERPADPYGGHVEVTGETEGFDLKASARRAAREAERKALLQVLERVRWNRTEAASVLKVSYKTLLTKIIECGIQSPRPSPRS